jgi:hypothetical protein
MGIRKTLELASALLAGAAAGAWAVHEGCLFPKAQATPANPQADDLATLKAEVARLKGVVPDQAHAMSDVGQHFAKLWFAGEAGNWPLAQFFLDETKSHLRWAVRIIPKRKDAEGREIDLGGILGGLETSTFKDLEQAVKGRDKEKFPAAYKAQLEGCMACHRASNKPFIRLRVPEKADSNILEFKPE